MDNEIGVMFTGAAELAPSLHQFRALGIRHGQIAIPGDLDVEAVATKWRSEIRAAGFTVHTLFGVYTGESYADIPTVRRTVGFVPEATRREREQRTIEIIGLASELRINGFATHIGCLPDDTLDRAYISVRDLVRRIADEAQKSNMTFALETGQERAEALLDFILDVNRENVGVNFDPANMVLYGAGDPIEAVDILGAHLITVHAKDAKLPSAAAPDSLGTEVPIGEGMVDFDAFLITLKKFGYEKPLFIEREVKDHQARLQDIERGKRYLETRVAEVR